MATSERDSSDACFELAVFLISSARGAPEEGVYTASLRLVEAASRLATISEDLAPDRFLRELGGTLRSDANTRYLTSKESYLEFLDEILVLVAKEVRRRIEALPDG